MTNCGSSRGLSASGSIKAYDKLPRRVRDALKDAHVDWAAQPYLKLWESGEWSVQRLVEKVAEDDRWHLEKSRDKASVFMRRVRDEAEIGQRTKRRKAA